MALGTTNINCKTVADLIADATVYEVIDGYNYINYFLLCASVNINRWSKYKPVRAYGIGTNIHVRGKDDVGYWGFNFSGSNPDKWDYLHPRGGSPGGTPDEPARLDDFRGYEHDRTLAYPSIQCRDTDNSWNANLYPSGTPYLQRWYCRAHRSASSVIIIPSDLNYGATNFDNLYVGLWTNATGGPWYKTFGQVKDLSWGAVWNININFEITNWATSPAFANFPYHIGAVDWILILSTGEAAAWTALTPGVIIYFPGITNGGSPDTWDTDGTNTYINAGSFTIKDWLKLSSYSKVFGVGADYSSVTVYCSTANLPAFTISKSGSWITLAVYDGATLISKPALYAPGMSVRISVDAAPDVSSVTVYKDASDANEWTIQSESGSVDPTIERDGSATVTSEGENAVVAVSQGYAGDEALTFTYNPLGGDDFPPSNATIEYVIKRGATQVYPSSGWATAIGQRAEHNNTVNIADIGETAQNTDYTVYIRLIL